MNFLKISIILVILFKLSHSEEKPPYVNRFCETKTFDYAFNFMDKEEFPNGIMIKKDDFVVVFNDDLFDRSFTKAEDINEIYKPENYTGGMSIKYIPKCVQFLYTTCPELRKAFGLQMVITTNNESSQKIVQYFKDKKKLQTKEEGLPFSLSEDPRDSYFFPQFSNWTQETDLLAYRTHNFELVFVSNSEHKVLWQSLSDWLADTKNLIDFDSNLKFFSAFELKGKIYLVHNREAPVIYIFDVDPANPKKRRLRERSDLSLYRLFECHIIYPPKTDSPETPFSVKLAKLLVIFLNVIMVILALCFLSLVVFHIFHTLYNKKSIHSKESSQSSKTVLDKDR